MASKNIIIARTNRNVEKDHLRVCLPSEAVEALNLFNGDNKVVVTVYPDKVVITKKKEGNKNGE